MTTNLFVIALGNPGDKYLKTRHNAGWIIVDDMFPGAVWEKNSYANTLEAIVGDFVLIKPLTFMNESGKVISWYQKKMGLTKERVVIIHDEIDIPLGLWKFSTARSNAGHNGIKSLEQFVNPVPRIRIGIGNENPQIKPNVLGNFLPEEAIILKTLAADIKKSLHRIAEVGVTKAQSMYR